jgi:hypothetical protein
VRRGWRRIIVNIGESRCPQSMEMRVGYEGSLRRQLLSVASTFELIIDTGQVTSWPRQMGSAARPRTIGPAGKAASLPCLPQPSQSNLSIRRTTHPLNDAVELT